MIGFPRPSSLSTAILTLVLLGSPAFPSEMRVASTDRLPLGDWTYDAMGYLASDSLVPGYAARVFQGDRLFNRMEMARVLAEVISNAAGQELTPRQRSTISHLVDELEPELRTIAQYELDRWRALGQAGTPRALLPMGYARVMRRDVEEAQRSTVLPYRVSVAADLSPRILAIATMADKEERFGHALRDARNPDKALITGSDGTSIWSVGREYQSWGPAYSGSLILSDSSPSFFGLQASRDINPVRFLGRLKITQFASTFKDDGHTLYLFGRRYEKALSSRWHAGLSETAKTSVLPNPLILVLPLQLYQLAFIEQDAQFNTLYSLDMSYTAGKGSEIYGELVIDDITAPRLLSSQHHFDRPRKIGYTLGVYLPYGRMSSLRAEYIFVDPLTYTATRSEFPYMAYTHDGQNIGHPIGPNANALYLRAEQYLRPRLSLIGEYFNQRQTEATDPQRGTSRFLSLLISYDLAANRSVGFRVAPFKITPPGGVSESATLWEVRTSYSF